MFISLSSVQLSQILQYLSKSALDKKPEGLHNTEQWNLDHGKMIELPSELWHTKDLLPQEGNYLVAIIEPLDVNSNVRSVPLLTIRCQ